MPFTCNWKRRQFDERVPWRNSGIKTSFFVYCVSDPQLPDCSAYVIDWQCCSYTAVSFFFSIHYMGRFRLSGSCHRKQLTSKYTHTDTLIERWAIRWKWVESESADAINKTQYTHKYIYPFDVHIICIQLLNVIRVYLISFFFLYIYSIYTPINIQTSSSFKLI